MNKSSAKLLAKTLKIGTWLGIFVALFFFFLTFRSDDQALGRSNTFYSLIALGCGYICNFIYKRITKLFLNDGQDEK